MRCQRKKENKKCAIFVKQTTHKRNLTNVFRTSKIPIEDYLIS